MMTVMLQRAQRFRVANLVETTIGLTDTLILRIHRKGNISNPGNFA